jgi:hypothetical protein
MFRAVVRRYDRWEEALRGADVLRRRTGLSRGFSVVDTVTTFTLLDKGRNFMLAPRDHFGVVLAYDVTSRESFDETVRLCHATRNAISDHSETVQVLIIGLEGDVRETDRRVVRPEAEEFTHRNGCRYKEI